MLPIDELNKVRKYCVKNLKDKELWPAYYNRRYLEFLSYLEKSPKKNFNQTLEIGCGMGYQTALLSKISGHVIATDLEDEDPQSNSIGLEPTRDFLKTIGIQNATVVNASNEALPFPDNHFDFVYSSHVLEHVPDKKRALSEISRVLTDDGIFLCIVPTRSDRLYTFIGYHFYLFRRAVFHSHRIIKSKFTKQKEPVGSKPITSLVENSGQFSSFPFPPPHGTADHYLKEVRDWSFGNWESLILKQSDFKIKSSTTTQLNPLLNILGTFMSGFILNVYKFTRKWESKLGKNNILKRFGLNAVFEIEKS